MRGNFVRKAEVNGDTALNPYWYLRNGLLHVRYTVDRCIRLSATEEKSLKEAITANPAYKQGTLERNWRFLTDLVGKEITNDGTAEAERQISVRHKN